MSLDGLNCVFSISYNQESNLRVNDLAFRYQGPSVDHALLESAAEGLRDAWGTHMVPNLSGTVRMVKVTGRQLVTPFTTAEVSASVDGANGSGATPPSSAMVITLRTGVAGRSHRGRIFLPGIPQDKVTDQGNLTSTFVSDVLSDLSSVLVDMAAVDDGWVLCVYSRVLDTFFDITAATAQSLMRQQRRREYGVGT